MARNNITITTTQEITIPDGFICSGKGNCYGLTDVGKNNIRVCSYFNSFVHWSDRGGFFQKCEGCIAATVKYFADGN